MKDLTVQDIKEQISDWKDVISSITGNDKIFTQKGAPCPSCGGKDRFAWHLKKQIFNCRICMATGDGFELLSLMLGDRKTAFKTLIQYLGLSSETVKITVEDKIMTELNRLTLTDLGGFDKRLTGCQALTNNVMIYAPLVRPVRVPRQNDSYANHLKVVDYIIYDYSDNLRYLRSDLMRLDKDIYRALAKAKQDKICLTHQDFEGVTVIGENKGARIYLCDNYLDALKANQLMKAQIWCVHGNWKIISKFFSECHHDYLRAVANVSYEELEALDYYDINVILPECEDLILDNQAMGRKLYTSSSAFDICL